MKFVIFEYLSLRSQHKSTTSTVERPVLDDKFLWGLLSLVQHPLSLTHLSSANSAGGSWCYLHYRAIYVHVLPGPCAMCCNGRVLWHFARFVCNTCKPHLTLDETDFQNMISRCTCTWINVFSVCDKYFFVSVCRFEQARWAADSQSEIPSYQVCESGMFLLL